MYLVFIEGSVEFLPSWIIGRTTHVGLTFAGASRSTAPSSTFASGWAFCTLSHRISSTESTLDPFSCLILLAGGGDDGSSSSNHRKRCSKLFMFQKLRQFTRLYSYILNEVDSTIEWFFQPVRNERACVSTRLKTNQSASVCARVCEIWGVRTFEKTHLNSTLTLRFGLNFWCNINVCRPTCT